MCIFIIVTSVSSLNVTEIIIDFFIKELNGSTKSLESEGVSYGALVGKHKIFKKSFFKTGDRI